MTDIITVTGVVGTDPRHTVLNGGLAITSFRLASTRRVFDRAKGTWEDGDTNWYTISAFRQLASNASLSIRKGERLIVHGRLRLRAWETSEKSGTAVEIEADSIGHDLAWCVTSYAKVRSARPADHAADGSSAADAADGFDSAAGDAAPSVSGWPEVSPRGPIELDVDHDTIDETETETDAAFDATPVGV
ncbi:single-stranded DNA-binding protein [Agromyces badenianii]|uniref:single-stranded DNA-binding protein n=1 Tax=Agromyces badenianii TaxID=2080742 RepID=UPI000D598F78|nr:single-stranded DNA-binding protein [Agromyces badenianii]PWC03988.1 single-stranded DNA-binding protein [Agromyces badenianii]